MSWVNVLVLSGLLASGLCCGTSAQQLPELQHRAKAGTASEQHRVVLDVVVSDGQGRPMAGLLASQFRVLDNKEPRVITSFEAPGTEPTEAVVVIDTINTPTGMIGRVEDQLRLFLQRDGGHLALPVSLLFLSDGEPKLRAGANTGDKGAMSIAHGQAFVHRVPASRDGNALAARVGEYQTSLGRILEAQGDKESERVRLSLQALDFIASAEASTPGRKLVLWIGPGWPLLRESASKTKEQLFSSITYLSTALQDARITLYSIDPEGVSGGGSSTSSAIDLAALRQSERRQGSPMTQVPVNSSGAGSYQAFLHGVRSAKEAEANDPALQVLAIQSGGLVLGLDNDLTGEITRCAAEANGMYTLSFEPLPAKGRDVYHAVQVKVAQQGANVRARTGFYAEP